MTGFFSRIAKYYRDLLEDTHDDNIAYFADASAKTFDKLAKWEKILFFGKSQ